MQFSPRNHARARCNGCAMKLTDLATALGAEVCNLTSDFEVRTITTLEQAGPEDISFVSSEKYAAAAGETRAGALIVPAALPEAALAALPSKMAVIPVAEPWAGVLHVLHKLHPESVRPAAAPGAHPTAVVDPSAQVAPDASLGPNVVVGPDCVIGPRTLISANCVLGRGCHIGEDCLLHPGVVLQHGTRLGHRVIIQPGAVLGADGFKYEVIGGRWTKIPQVGTVEVADDAEVGALTCIDRASFTTTTIGPNTKIDNLVQIAHNVKIGGHCIIVSQTGVAGSTEVGDGSILAAQVGVADNLKLGRRTVVLARAAVKDHLPDGATVLGTPARPFRQAARIIAAEARLPDMMKELDQLKTRLAVLEEQLRPKS